MRITITLILAVFLASCSSVKNCGVKPNVEIVLEKQTKTGEENKSTADLIKESVQPGGQINCSF